MILQLISDERILLLFERARWWHFFPYRSYSFIRLLQIYTYIRQKVLRQETGVEIYRFHAPYTCVVLQQNQQYSGSSTDSTTVMLVKMNVFSMRMSNQAITYVYFKQCIFLIIYHQKFSRRGKKHSFALKFLLMNYLHKM